MTDKEMILEELKKSTSDLEEQKLLIDICKQIFEKYDEGSSKAIGEFLQEKVNPLKNNFFEAHTKLLKKMGISEGIHNGRPVDIERNNN